jgi:hypothetical protein
MICSPTPQQRGQRRWQGAPNLLRDCWGTDLLPSCFTRTCSRAAAAGPPRGGGWPAGWSAVPDAAGGAALPARRTGRAGPLAILASQACRNVCVVTAARGWHLLPIASQHQNHTAGCGFWPELARWLCQGASPACARGHGWPDSQQDLPCPRASPQPWPGGVRAVQCGAAPSELAQQRNTAAECYVLRCSTAHQRSGLYVRVTPCVCASTSAKPAQHASSVPQGALASPFRGQCCSAPCLLAQSAGHTLVF